MGKIDFRQKMLDDFIIVQMDVEAATRIKLPDWQRILRGTVVAVGPGRMLTTGKRARMECRLGDEVMFTATAGMDTSYGGRVNVRMMKDADVDAILKRAPRASNTRA